MIGCVCWEQSVSRGTPATVPAPEMATPEEVSTPLEGREPGIAVLYCNCTWAPPDVATWAERDMD